MSGSQPMGCSSTGFQRMKMLEGEGSRLAFEDGDEPFL